MSERGKATINTKKCERCHEEKSIVLFRGRTDFLMPWCKECRAIDPRGAKLINDRLRQAQLSEEKLREKNERRKLRAREIRQEVKAAQEKACDLALAALTDIDLSAYQGRERKEIERELKRIREVIKSLK